MPLISEVGSTEWALEMIGRISQGAEEAKLRREELADATDALTAGLASIRTSPWQCRRHSQAGLDERAGSVTLGDQVEQVNELLRSETSVALLSAVDQLRGYSTLLRAQTSALGAASLGRGVFESLVWASAMLDPHVSTEVRVQRALSRRLARLSAAIRIRKLLRGASVEADMDINNSAGAKEGAEAPEYEVSIEHIEAYAKSQNWTVKRGRWAPEINTPLSIDWLASNLGQRLGIEDYAWTSSSAMAHVEHPNDVVAHLELTEQLSSSPAWLMQLWSTGVWAGPRLFLATFAAYTQRGELVDEWPRFNNAFWDRGGPPIS